MAGGGGTIGRIFVLLILILVLAGAGILWFNYLNVFDARTTLAPVFNFFGLGGRTQPDTTEMLNLNDERYAILLEALELRNLELATWETDIRIRQGEIEQIAQELEEQRKAIEEMEISLIGQQLEADIRDRNVEQNARNLVGMPPERAVGILAAMDDQDVIDVLRKTEEIAQAEGNASIVPYWLSLLPPDRAAEITRKMAARP